jgi:branched-chain amino acid transport system substrate-binding protein
MLGVEGIRKAQEKFGRRPLIGEQVRWGLENLDLDEARLKELGFESMMRPIKISCADHEGARTARIQQWNGKSWNVISDWYTADETITAPLVKEVSTKYATEKKITPRDCSKEN